MLNIGQQVFVPNYGAGVITNIVEKNALDNNDLNKTFKYIYIALLLDNMNLYIPENKIDDYRIRDIVSIEYAESALKVISNKSALIEKKWGKRYRGNNEKIISGDFVKECEVLRDLYYLQNNNMLPHGEKKILERVEKLVSSEMVLAFKINFQDSIYKMRKLGKQIDN